MHGMCYALSFYTYLLKCPKVLNYLRKQEVIENTLRFFVNIGDIEILILPT